jgi:L-threonylcarbamoyladenylate synthase
MSPPNPPFATEIRPYGKAAVEEAARLILEGLPVAVPTETVYGLAADATDGEAVARIYAAKGRPSFNPLIVHVRDLNHARELGDLPDAALKAAAAFWPGPLTFVVPRRAESPVAALATAGLSTIALRCPAHPAMQDLLAACGRPLAAPSANVSGAISPTCAAHVIKTLAGRIPLVIDGGATERGIESTIVRFDDDSASLLRPGPISFEEVLAASGASAAQASGGIQAPGQLASHYAPSKPLRLNAPDAQEDEWKIGFGECTCDSNLSPAGDLIEAAARLFDLLHEADMQPLPKIAVAPVPETGVGIAINDRLRRAAAPRQGVLRTWM